MDLFESLSAQVQRIYAGRRSDLPRSVFCDDDAANYLADDLKADVIGHRACVLFDRRTRTVAANLCLDALRRHGWQPSALLVPDPVGGGSPVCDDLTKAHLLNLLPPADALIAIGSGVINDLTKWLAADAGLPYAVFATASSMNGYSSANVAPKIAGVKCLAQGRAARVIAAAPTVLRDAPYRLTASGFGDLLAKPVSTADWIVNNEIFDEDYCAALAALTDRFEPMVFERPDALANGEHEAVSALFEALVLSGCTMTLHGSSLPASGGEHILSHTLDMMSDADGHPHDLHGRQVGVTSVLSAALWEQMTQMDHPKFEPIVPPFDPEVWGPAADAVEKQREAKVANIERACAHLSRPRAWQALRKRLEPHLLSPSVLREQLQRANAAWKLEHIGCSRDRFLSAVHHAGAMRGRFTSVDLAHIVGLLPAHTEELVDAWVA